MEEFVIRVGTFFIVIGVGIFILFIASDYAHQTDFDYLFWSIIIIAFGMLLRRRRPPPPPSGRFSTWRKWREGSKKRKEEKK
jgi:hypothetical protein